MPYTFATPADLAKESLYYQPFNMLGSVPGSFGNSTASLNATHPSLDKYPSGLYNHNLNGYQSVKTLNSALNKDATLKDHNGKRPWIMSDSTSPGAGQFGGSWLSHYRRTWTDMKHSIAGVMNLNMFGISMAGSEVCGALGPFDEELCARWTQNAVLFPHMRNYYADKFYNMTSDQFEMNPAGELYMGNGGDDKTFQWSLAAGAAVRERYTFLQYIYSQLYASSTQGKQYIRPCFFDEP